MDDILRQRLVKLMERIDPDTRKHHVEQQAKQFSEGFLVKYDELQLLTNAHAELDGRYTDEVLDTLPQAAREQISVELTMQEYRIESMEVALETGAAELDRLLNEVDAIKNVGLPSNRAGRRATAKG
jgi:hypothetical protein